MTKKKHRIQTIRRNGDLLPRPLGQTIALYRTNHGARQEKEEKRPDSMDRGSNQGLRSNQDDHRRGRDTVLPRFRKIIRNPHLLQQLPNGCGHQSRRKTGRVLVKETYRDPANVSNN